MSRGQLIFILVSTLFIATGCGSDKSGGGGAVGTTPEEDCSQYTYDHQYGGYVDQNNQRVTCGYENPRGHHPRNAGNCYYDFQQGRYIDRHTKEPAPYCNQQFDYQVYFPYYGSWGSDCSYWSNQMGFGAFFSLWVGGAYVCVNANYYHSPQWGQWGGHGGGHFSGQWYNTGRSCMAGTVQSSGCQCIIYHNSMRGQVHCRY